MTDLVNTRKPGYPLPLQPVNAAAKVPNGERGTIATAGTFLHSWGALIDERETTQELAWPLSHQTFRLMMTDSQVRGLLRSMILPITRYKWAIDPQGARPEVYTKLAEDFNLPVLGEEIPAPRLRNKNRFSFKKHLELTLKTSLGYGFVMFEQVAELRDGMVRIKKLAPRMPWMIDQINVDRDGGLRSIEQPGNGVMQKIEIPVDRLVAYVWDQEPGNWFGQSMLRSMYKPWLIKDRVIRVGAINIQRAGAGVPIIEAPPGATPSEITALGTMAQAYKAGEDAGGAIPNGSRLTLAGVQGAQPDAIGYIRLMNEEMARSSLQMFMQLGQTETGSRALGQSFIDYFSLAQQAVAEWFCEVTNEHVVEDWVDWNFGENEAAPAIVFEADGDPELAVQDLATMAERGLVVVDATLREWLRDRYKMPVEEIKEDAPGGQSFGYDLDNGIVTIDERRAQIGLPPKEDGTGKMTVPEYLEQYGGAATAENALGFDPSSDGLGTSHRGTTPAGTRRSKPPKKARGRLNRIKTALRGGEAPWAALLPDRELAREPFEHEILAQVDFKALDEDWEEKTEKAVDKWGPIKQEQIDSLVTQIEAVADDLEALAKVEAPVLGSDMLTSEMQDLAQKAADQATEEAVKQGTAMVVPDIDEVIMRERADAVAQLMARSIGEAGARQAINRAGPTSTLSAAEIAGEVRTHLESLSDAYVRDQLGGAMTAAQNTGRMEVMGQAEGDIQVYSSELLDGRTCDSCASVDGEQYMSLNEAQSDYPTGGYKDCDGGVRCRGTLVAIYGETEATS